ncbi:FKBP-type peptidyl-prolyl cis-trans isomerase [Altererythrobacter aquaemixtae]|uniref:Peptidyl-prolyl cis-trans isomerase n=2 Tax=Pontixanthobacter aquaemixtae TaxID=1958940 RepID=A0A845A1K5_9SPHN|nr:FKBP-type peptidyl-prolyl cis-trans isomerase [Pontixanthobacter aquaemixtae]
MRKLCASTCAAVLLGGFASQTAAQDTPAEAAPSTAQDAAWHNQQQIALAQRTYKDGWRWMEGGLLWRRIKGNGSGARPTVADTVTLHYAGTFVDGTGFDSSYGRGEPATFPLGRLIKAWQLAVPQMAVGDTIEIAAPASIAYGPVGKGPIPGGATLLFTIELLGIEGR